MNHAAAITAAIIAFVVGLLLGHAAYRDTTMKDCLLLGALRIGDATFDCRLAPPKTPLAPTKVLT